MSSTGDDKEREETALDALVVAAFKDEPCELGEKDIERLTGAMSAEDQAALDAALGPNFIGALFAGDARKKVRKERGALSTAMNRSDKEDEPPTDKAKEEMDRKVREAEERRRAEEGEQREGPDDGRRD